MKPTTRFLLFIFICFSINILNAFSQDDCDKCPMNIKDAINDPRFEQADDDSSYLSKSTQPELICIYYENGKLKFEIPYKNDLMEGIVTRYTENGQIDLTVTYSEGVPESGMYHHTNGTTPLTDAELTDFKNTVPCHQDLAVAQYDSGTNKFSFEEIVGAFRDGPDNSRFFVIKGFVRNNYPKIKHSILLLACIIDNKGNIVLEQNSYAGTKAGDEQLSAMSGLKRNELMKKGDRETFVEPESRIPFLIEFDNLPNNVEEFSVEFISASSAE